MKCLDRIVAGILAAVLALNAALVPLAHGPGCHLASGSASGCTVDCGSSHGHHGHRHHPHATGTNGSRGFGAHDTFATPRGRAGVPIIQGGGRHGVGVHDHHLCLACQYLSEFQAAVAAPAGAMSADVVCAWIGFPVRVDSIQTFSPFSARAPPGNLA
ncbi:MAG: hypothetical protein FJ295_06865 [Planctomycetes bacterium]|nr:hypothetical protein [Planctomycetota bacterium]